MSAYQAMERSEDHFPETLLCAISYGANILAPYPHSYFINLKAKVMISINLHIKNMVCSRCIFVIKSELKVLGANILSLELGYASISIPVSLSLSTIESRLEQHGFELLDNKEDVLVEEIKIAISEYAHNQEESISEVTLSEFLARQLGKNYNYLSKLFSKHESQTIERKFIEVRIERVKQLLDYDELTLSEIAIKLGYSSVHYLSNQFKKVTGRSVSQYKQHIKFLHSKYDSLDYALNDLKSQGFVHDFTRQDDQLECKQLDTLFDPRSLKMEEVYRFKEASSQMGKSVVFAIDTGNNVKGVLVESHIRN